jgi:hypothetical protein
MSVKPKVNSAGERELENVAKQFDAFDANVKELTQDAMNKAPKLETEPQTKIAKADIEKSKDVYLKPKRTIGSVEKFNEKFREQFNFAKEYVCFIAENKELIGEAIELWTKPFPGLPAEEWVVPANTPVYGPRYLAERLKSCNYHRLVMKQSMSDNRNPDAMFYGNMVADSIIQRIDAFPVSNTKSIFMGASGF